MIPSVLTHQLRQGVADFLDTTFPVSTPFFNTIISSLVAADNAVFKGPYLSLGLPFEKGLAGRDFFSDIPLGFTPHRHQEQAFARLGGPEPRSTLVATGTGSGKTECFVLPILDHCGKHAHESGIKAILIYPMNALATDQAQRLARAIWNNPALKGRVTAGLFIGQRESHPAKTMGPDTLITDRDTLRLSPPDILLTNYRMLDFLLVKQEHRPLWSQNQPETLRFLVVDELHTFDGAQATDLACLIRRLKARLGSPPGHLCCVGTSATLGGEQGGEFLLQYARAVFAEPFDADGVITETRISAGRFLEDSLIQYTDVPRPGPDLDPDTFDRPEDFVRAQHRLWFHEELGEADTWRQDLAERLKGHLFFQNLLKVLSNRTRAFENILEDLRRVSSRLRRMDTADQIRVLESLLALVSEARQPGSPSEPLVHVRMQLWLRELRRMVCKVAPSPTLEFADNLTDEQRRTHLPLVHCRECGAMGWAAVRHRHEPHLATDLKDFYIAFFNNDPKTVFLFPENPADARDTDKGRHTRLCPTCLRLLEEDDRQCPACGDEDPICVYLPDTTTRRGNRRVSERHCPYCSGHQSLTIVGSRAASLTSVLCAQLYGSPYNNDKKILAFSDNVQDAAHRAGFFAARTYRFTLRGAIQKFVRDKGQGLTLDKLPSAFSRYWTDRLDQNRYIAFFIAPDMTWMADYDFLQEHGHLPKDSGLITGVNNRLSWEIFSEYGFNARIGRTLEKTGSSVVQVDPQRLKQVLPGLLEALQNEIGHLTGLDQPTLHRLVTGLCVQLKNKGGILHPVLENYINKGGNSWVISGRHIPYMPYFGHATRAPVFLTTRSGSRFDTLTSGQEPSPTWYENWADRCLEPAHLLVRPLIGDVYTIVLRHLVAAGILKEQKVGADRVWGLNPEALVVSTQVAQLRCTTCGHQVSAQAGEKEILEGAVCLRYRCQGTYTPRPAEPDYYGRMYSTGDLERLFCAEHTGLLKREERETLEREFKADATHRQPWYPNLLSCTPTLEMGIDIGDLSSLILCSIPPAQANYLQRIGRAGRRDGNALSIAVANGRPHDLYFYAEPMEMISGQVEPPGIFLNAAAVLERQLTAFCLDRWVDSGLSPGAVPPKLGQVLSNLEPQDPARFPNNFRRFVETYRDRLFEDFLALFQGEILEASQEQLAVFFKGDGSESPDLFYRIMSELNQLHKERESLKKKIQVLAGRIKRKRKEPARDRNHEAQLDEMVREKSALQALVKSIQDRDTFNFFTDAGLLPNYAFPEAGVLLRSLIYRRREKPGKKGTLYDTWVYEYERPASSAISELAPENDFHAQSRKVEIDQVDMTVSEIESWRLCNNCSHMERATTDGESPVCPRCQSPMWADSGQKRQMLRLRQVFATTDDRASRIGDDGDDREPRFYNKQMMVDFAEDHVTDAYRIDSDDLPFGFEFLSRATFREINFGEKGGKYSRGLSPHIVYLLIHG